jgi:hypothetical protein
MTETCSTNPLVISVHEQLAAMHAKGLQHFEPVQFCYMESMVRRAMQQNTSVAQTIVTKIQAAIDEYQSNYLLTRKQFATRVDKISQYYPEQSAVLHDYLTNNNFKAIAALTDKLEQGERSNGLKALTRQLRQAQTGNHHTALLTALNHDWPAQGHSAYQRPDQGATSSNNTELKSLNSFRDSLAKEHAKNRVSEAIANAPKNAGPLNPEMLAIRSLAAIRDLSPDYLSRFVAYMDTLLWLEQAAGSKDPRHTVRKSNKAKAPKS